MSRADTHMERSHRSRHNYVPICKTIKNKERKNRNGINRLMAAMSLNKKRTGNE